MSTTVPVAKSLRETLTNYADVSATPGKFAIRMQGGILILRIRQKPDAVIPTALVLPDWEQMIQEEVAVPYVDGSLVKGIVARLNHIFANVIPDFMPINLGDRGVIYREISRLSDAQIEPEK